LPNSETGGRREGSLRLMFSLISQRMERCLRRVTLSLRTERNTPLLYTLGGIYTTVVHIGRHMGIYTTVVHIGRLHREAYPPWYPREAT